MWKALQKYANLSYSIFFIVEHPSIFLLPELEKESSEGQVDEDYYPSNWNDVIKDGWVELPGNIVSQRVVVDPSVLTKV